MNETELGVENAESGMRESDISKGHRENAERRESWLLLDDKITPKLKKEFYALAVQLFIIWRSVLSA